LQAVSFLHNTANSSRAIRTHPTPTPSPTPPHQDVPVQDVKRLFEVNYLGSVALVRAFAPGMIRRRSGTIINVG